MRALNTVQIPTGPARSRGGAAGAASRRLARQADHSRDSAVHRCGARGIGRLHVAPCAWPKHGLGQENRGRLEQGRRSRRRSRPAQSDSCGKTMARAEHGNADSTMAGNRPRRPKGRRRHFEPPVALPRDKPAQGRRTARLRLRAAAAFFLFFLAGRAAAGMRGPRRIWARPAAAPVACARAGFSSLAGRAAARQMPAAPARAHGAADRPAAGPARTPAASRRVALGRRRRAGIRLPESRPGLIAGLHARRSMRPPVLRALRPPAPRAAAAQCKLRPTPASGAARASRKRPGRGYCSSPNAHATQERAAVRPICHRATGQPCWYTAWRPPPS